MLGELDILIFRAFLESLLISLKASTLEGVFCGKIKEGSFSIRTIQSLEEIARVERKTYIKSWRECIDKECCSVNTNLLYVMLPSSQVFMSGNRK